MLSHLSLRIPLYASTSRLPPHVSNGTYEPQELRAEIPETAQALRLTAVEASDTMEEFGYLGADLTAGLRASARLATDAEGAMKQVPYQVKKLVRATGPVANRVTGPLVDVLEEALQANAQLDLATNKLRHARRRSEAIRAVVRGLETARTTAPYAAAVAGTLQETLRQVSGAKQATAEVGYYDAGRPPTHPGGDLVEEWDEGGAPERSVPSGA